MLLGHAYGTLDIDLKEATLIMLGLPSLFSRRFIK